VRWLPVTILGVGLLLAGRPAAAPAADAPLVVANPSVPVDAIGTDELRRIFLGKRSRWEDGQPASPVMLADGPVHEQFVASVLGRTVEKFVTYWKQMVFTGKGIPPRTFATPAELAAFVRTEAGAVGYLPAGADTTGLKILHLR